MNLMRHLQKKSANATLPRRGQAIALCAVMLATSAVAFAQGLPDPTRPPAGFVDPAEPGALAGAVPPAATAQSSGSGDDPEGLVLQSVMLPQRGKPVAIINGKYVPLGAQIDGWELKSVSERAVTVQQGSNRHSLRLTPLVSKSLVPAESAAPEKKPLRKNKVKKAVVKESESKQ